MTTEKDLMEIRSLPKILEKMCGELQAVSDRLYPASPILSAMPKGSPNHGKMPDAISILEDEKQRLLDYVASINEKEVRAWNDTMKIPNPSARNIIILYYFERVETWEEVERLTKYSNSQVKRLRASAFEFLSSC